MKYAVLTFGCRVNQADSLAIEADLRALGGREAPASDADLVLVNTCSVTASADQGARQTVRRVARDNPLARIVVTGCYATRRPDEIASLPGVVRVVPNSSKAALVSSVAGLLDSCTAERYGDGDGACGAPIAPGAAGRTAFTLRVQTGCEERCSYCIIPSTRGAARSLPLDDVRRAVERAASAGFTEVALTGVHLGSYGRDLSPTPTLDELLRALTDCAPGVLFRVSSLEPMDCPAELVRLAAERPGRIAPHFHLPLQHASDAVLARMQRPYTLARYRALVETILSLMPHASIGSDVIAGFPGETDGEFAANLEYLPVSGLSHLHVFPYSDRPGTPASRMEGKVPAPVIRERASTLRTIGSALSRRFRVSQIGSLRPGLTLEDGTLVVTDNYLKLRVAPGVARNVRVMVRVEGEAEGTVVG